MCSFPDCTVVSHWVRTRALGLSGDPQRAGALLVFWECQKIRGKAGAGASLGQQCRLGSTETLRAGHQAGLDAVARVDPADVVSALLQLLGGVGEWARWGCWLLAPPLPPRRSGWQHSAVAQAQLSGGWQPWARGPGTACSRWSICAGEPRLSGA